MCKKGDYEGALVMLKKALSICEKSLGEDHPHTAKAYNNIGGVMRQKGDYEGALVMFQKSLTITEKSLGKEHPNTVNIYQWIDIVKAHLTLK